MPASLPDAAKPKAFRLRWPTGMPQVIALLVVLFVDSIVANNFSRFISKMDVCLAV